MRDTAKCKVSEQLVFATLGTLFIAVVEIRKSRSRCLT
jgi:hypothetical protein